MENIELTEKELLDIIDNWRNFGVGTMQGACQAQAILDYRKVNSQISWPGQ